METPTSNSVVVTNRAASTANSSTSQEPGNSAQRYPQPHLDPIRVLDSSEGSTPFDPLCSRNSLLIVVTPSAASTPYRLTSQASSKTARLVYLSLDATGKCTSFNLCSPIQHSGVVTPIAAPTSCSSTSQAPGNSAQSLVYPHSDQTRVLEFGSKDFLAFAHEVSSL